VNMIFANAPCDAFLFLSEAIGAKLAVSWRLVPKETASARGAGSSRTGLKNLVEDLETQLREPT
jgi:hypothetical protein